MNKKNAINIITLLPVIWLFSGFMLIHGGDKIIVPVILISIIFCLFCYKLSNIKENYKNPYIILLALSSLVFLVLYETIGFGSGELRSYIAVTLYLLVIPKDVLTVKKLEWLLFIAACSSCAMLTYNRYELDILRGVNTFNAIPYSITLSVYAVAALYLSLFKKSKVSIITYILLFIGIFITETRGAIFSLVITSAIMCALAAKINKRLHIRHALVALLAISVVLVSSFEVIKDRVDMTVVELQRLSEGDIDMTSSIALRFQFWQAATKLYTKSPIYGLGDSHTHELQVLHQSGLVSDLVAEYSPAHYHNQYIDKSVKSGVLGLILLLAVQLIPCVISYKRRAKDRLLIYMLTILITLAGLTDTPMSQPFSLLPILLLIYLLLNCNKESVNDDTEMKPH
ncbi:hypothetical protein BCT19_09000 [Vibrio splendidus]|uniref:O-antigen ligase family protein n=1 Tax=Vibrio splendidus TaxID=29497 RepID=UPI000C825BC0|nr:O-antigen ligase family protein [Vibrio splendidus]MCC5519724.1 O-antigen ligase family protein [Vibrio splendidus]PMO06205.1 hypothetical protein BCT19_09000 [Vibrio splendidus]